jgi:hypothetical protein
MPLTFQTPSNTNFEKIQNKKGYNELQVPLSCKNSKKTDEFITFLRDLDAKFIKDAKKFGSVWFGRTKNITYKSVIRSSDENKEEYKNGVLRVKLLNSNNFRTQILLDNDSEMTIDQIGENFYVKMILECYALWITKDGFGLYLRPVLLSFTPKIIDYTYSLLEDSDNEEDYNYDDIIETEVEGFKEEINNQIASDEEDVEENIEILKGLQIHNIETDQITSEYVNDDNNITTYQNYLTEAEEGTNQVKQLDSKDDILDNLPEKTISESDSEGEDDNKEESANEKYDDVVLGGNKGDKSKTHDGEDFEDEDEKDESANEKYDDVVLGGNKGDKSKTHDGEDYEEEDEKDESVEEGVAEIITKIEGDELAGEEAGADGIAIPVEKGDGPETAAGIAGDTMDMGKPKSVEGKGKELITPDQKITDVVKGEADDKADGTEIVKEEEEVLPDDSIAEKFRKLAANKLGKVNEAEIKSADQFKEYAMKMLKAPTIAP